MTHSNSPVRVLASIVVASFAALTTPQAEGLIPPVCPLAIHEATLDLHEAVLEVRPHGVEQHRRHRVLVDAARVVVDGEDLAGLGDAAPDNEGATGDDAEE